MTMLKTRGLEITYKDGRRTVFYIYKGKSWTPYGHCVDHGSYYEIANWSSYTRIDKATMAVTSDAKDVDVFAPVDGVFAKVVKLDIAA